jgi:hypothetical protein
MSLIIAKPRGIGYKSEMEAIIRHEFTKADDVGVVFSKKGEEGVKYYKGSTHRITVESILYTAKAAKEDEILIINFRRAGMFSKDPRNSQPLFISTGNKEIFNNFVNAGKETDVPMMFQHGYIPKQTVNLSILGFTPSDTAEFIFAKLGYKSTIEDIKNDTKKVFDSAYRNRSLGEYSKTLVVLPNKQVFYASDNFRKYQGWLFSDYSFGAGVNVTIDGKTIKKYDLPKPNPEGNYIIKTTPKSFSHSNSSYDKTPERSKADEESLFNPNKGKLFSEDIPEDFYENVEEENTTSSNSSSEKSTNMSIVKRGTTQMCAVEKFPLLDSTIDKLSLIATKDHLNVKKGDVGEIIKIVNDRLFRVEIQRVGFNTNRVFTYQELKETFSLTAKKGEERFFDDYLKLSRGIVISKNKLKKLKVRFNNGVSNRSDEVKVLNLGNISMESLDVFIDITEEMLSNVKQEQTA